MKLNERINNNIFSIVIGIIIVTVGVTFSVVNYFYQQTKENLINKYETELINCNSDISFINRGVKDNEALIFNYNDVFVDKNSSLINTSKLQFHSNEEFYTQSDTSYWKYENTNESDVAIFQQLNEEGEISLKLFNAIKRSKNKLHFWLGNDYHVLNNVNILGNWGVVKFTPSITFQKASIDSLSKIAYSLEMPDSNNIRVKGNYLMEFRSKVFTNLILSFLFQQKSLLNSYDNAVLELLDIQKQNDFIYIRTLTILNNPKVDNKMVEKFYNQTELICLVRNNYLYQIIIQDPKLDRLSINPEITKWLSNLKIII